MQRRDEADLERVATAVEQPHRDVAAVRVGAEEVVGRARSARSGCPVGLTMSTFLPPTLTVPVMFSVARPGVRDVVRVDRRQQAQHDDQQEHAHRRTARSCCAAAGARRASHGPIPGGSSSPSAPTRSGGESPENSVPVSMSRESPFRIRGPGQPTLSRPAVHRVITSVGTRSSPTRRSGAGAPRRS